MNVSKKVKELILELGKESGVLTESDDKENFVLEMINNSDFENTYNRDQVYSVYEKAANGDIGSLVEIRKAWGLSVLR